MRYFAAFVLLILSQPALAQTDRTPDWVGVYEGTIGKYPVMVCLDESYDGKGRGSYYYLKYLKAIRLEADDPARSWNEHGSSSPVEAEAGPVWNIKSMDGQVITGSWQGITSSMLAIKLRRVSHYPMVDEYDTPCGSARFLRPRVVKPEFTDTAKEKDGFVYSELAFSNSGHFEDVSIAGLTFEPSQPGDPAVLDQLAAMLPQGKVEDDYIQCMAGVLSLHGVDGYYERGMTLEFVNDELLSVASSNSSYCGGAHPNHWTEFHVFDRNSGRALKPESWINSKGAELTDYGTRIVLPALRAVVMKHWSAGEDGDPECRSFVEDQNYWNYQLLREGILFKPDLPHVATACELPALVPWAELEPFLNKEGRAIRARVGG